MGTGVTEGMVARLEHDRPLLAQVGTADRVASLLRDNIMEGVFPPGTRLSEEAIGQALGVSRNTLREAFRLLCHERLAVHELNRGIFVPVLTTEDVVDLYRLRRLVEGSAIRMADQAAGAARQAVVAGVTDGETAAAAGDWQGVRSADLHFHQAVAALAGSPRVDELMRRVLAELRLVFHVMTDPEQFHRPFLARNKVIADLVEAGDGVAAEKELLSYLESAEQQLLAAYQAAYRVAQG
jgi:DNA-binding GntR family transcriptional regulator